MKPNKIFLLISVYLLFSIFIVKQSTQTALVRDGSHNLIMTFADKTTSTGNQIISFRFYFPEESSSTLPYGAYFAAEFSQITFPNTLASFSCALKSSTTNYIVEKVLSLSSTFSSTPVNTNTLYCKFSDINNQQLSKQVMYTLTYELTTRISTYYVDQIKLYTTTSNNPDHLILDYLPVFTNIGFLESTSKVITLVEARFNIISGINSGSVLYSTSNIYPYSTFELVLTILINTEYSIQMKDFSWILKYNEQIYNITTNISSEDNSSLALQKSLNNSLLSASKLNDNSILITTTESLFDQRVFKLRFTGCSVLDTGIGLTNKIETLLMYKNTHSLVSYHSLSINPIQSLVISGPNGNTKPLVHHSEWFVLFDGMGWPLKFRFNFNIDISSGGYMMIRQSNTIDVSSRWTFVAASCDFTSGFSEQSIGKRHNCFPLRNDFKYTTSLGTTNEYEGHGIFFKIDSIKTGVNYELIVWGFAERCGTTTDATNTGVTTFYTNFSFVIKLFKYVYQNGYYDENRIINSNNIVLAIANNVTMTEKCFAGTHLDPNNINLFSPNSNNLFTHESTNFMTTSKTSQTIDPTSDATMKTDAFGFYGQDLTFQKGGSASKRDKGALTEKFLYGVTDDIGVGSYLVISKFTTTDIVNGTTQAIAKYIPSECSNFTGANLFQSSRWEFVFSKNWFVKGDDYKSIGCFASIAFYNNYDDVSNPTSPILTKHSWQKLIPNRFNTNGDDNSAPVNFIYSKLTGFPNTAPTESIDITNSTMPPHILESETGRTSTYRLVSIKDTVAGGVRSMFSTIKNCNDNITANSNAANRYTPGFVEHAFMTTCLKWKSDPPNITSLYSYFDVQWHNVVQPTTFSLDDPITRVWRYVKLYPETGIFHNPNDVVYKGLTDSRLITGHFAWTAAKESPWAVCIFEINGKALQDSYTTLSNTLIIWLFATSLIESDFTNSGSYYPIAPIVNSSVHGYGLNSGQTISTMNRLTSEMNSGTISNVTTQPNTYLDKLFFSTNANYNNPSVTKFSVFEANRSMYQFLLGSRIMITGFNSNEVTTNETSPTTYPPLLIPFLCPQYSDSTTTTYGTNGNAFSIPTVMVQWATVTDNTTIDSINKTLADSTKSGMNIFSDYSIKDNIGTNNDYQLVSISLYKGINTNTLSSQNNWAGVSAAMTVSSSYINTNVRFNSYSPTSNSNSEFYLFPTAATKITSIAIFSNEYIKYDSSTTTTSNGSTKATGFSSLNNIYLSSYDNTNTDNNDFYINGKKFDKIGLGVISPGWITATKQQIIPIEIDVVATPYSSNSVYSVIGLTRPSLEDYLLNSINNSNIDSSNNNFNCLDFIGVTCASAIGGSANSILANYAYDDVIVTNNLKDFYLDYNPYSSDWSVISFTKDPSTIVYFADSAGSLYLDVVIPTVVPNGTSFSFDIETGSFINSGVTVCGMQDKVNSIVIECDINLNTVNCNYSRFSTDNFQVCCYNVNYSANTIDLISATVTIPLLSEYTNMSTYINNNIYTTFTNPAATFTNNNSVAVDLVSLGTTASLSRLSYLHSNQEYGLGVVQMLITTPREPTRGGKLTITNPVFSNFSPDYYNSNTSSLSLSSNMKVRCEVFLRSDFIGDNASGTSQYIFNEINSNDYYNSISWDKNFMIDSCFYNSPTGTINVSFKNIVYKCSLSISKDIVIILSPVTIIDFTNSDYSTDNITKINLYSKSNTKLIAESSLVVSQEDTLTHDSIEVSTSLCDVTSISPLIISEYADYKFSFITPTNNNMNEISIIFDYEIFGDTVENVVCLYQNIPQNCSFETKTLLNVRFESFLPTSSTIEIVIAGIINPTNITNKTFLCTINNSDYSENTTTSRKILIKGKGTITQTTHASKNTSITNSEVTTSGALFILNNNDFVEFEARSEPTLRIDVGFDKNYPSKSLIMSGYPKFIVTLPKQFKSDWYYTEMNSMRANITETTIETFTDDETIYRTFPNIIPDIKGNKLELPLGPESVEFLVKTKYWRIIFSGLKTPPDISESDFSYTTDKFKVVLTNNGNDVFFKTYDNLFLFGNSKAIPMKEYLDEYLTYYRGLKYQFSKSLFVVDVNNKDKENYNRNKMLLFPGRYSTYYFYIRNNNDSGSAENSINNDLALIQLSHDMFKTYDSNYLISSAKMTPVEFKIGLSCGKPIGYYLVFFSYIEDLTTTPNIELPTYFAKLSPIQVIVNENIPKAKIIVTTPSSVPVAGSAFIYYSLSEPNFDKFSISWTPSTSETYISSTSINVKTEKAYAQYTSKDDALTNSITFNIVEQELSKCYEIYSDINTASSKIVLFISSISAVIPNNAITTSNIYFYNAQDTNFDSNTNNNIPYNSVKMVFKTDYIPLFLYCGMTCFDKNFETDDFFINIDLESYSNSTVQYKIGYYSTDDEEYSLLFENLIRGIAYKLKCVFLSTEGDENKRTSSSVIKYYNYINYLNGTITEQPLHASNRHETWCLKYTFNSNPGISVLNIILEYCQLIFSNSNWENSGCGVCADIYGNTNIGFDLPNENNCTALISNFQNYDGYYEKTSLDTFYYTVCAVQYPLCKSDFSDTFDNSDKDLNNIVSYEDLFNKFLEGLNDRDDFIKMGVSNILEVETKTIKDNTFPEKPYLTNYVYNSNDYIFSFELNSENDLICYYKVNNDQESSVSEILACNSTSTSSYNVNATCGIIKSSLGGVSASIDYLKNVTETTTLYGDATCFPYIPYPQIINKNQVNLFTEKVTIESSSIDDSDFTDVVIGDLGFYLKCDISFVSFISLMMYLGLYN